MTSPISDILKAHKIPQDVVHDFSMPGTPRTYDNLQSCEQAITALLEAAIGEDENNWTNSLSLSRVEIRNQLRAEIRQKLGIGGNKG